MIIRHSNFLLEQLSEVEEKISLLEAMMEKYNIDWDKETLLKELLARRNASSDGQ